MKYVPKVLVNNNSVPVNRLQTIIWTADGQVYWLLYASFGLNELLNGMWPT